MNACHNLCALLSTLTLVSEAWAGDAFTPKVDVNPAGLVSICVSNTPITDVVFLINAAFVKQHSPPLFRIDLHFTNWWENNSRDRFCVPAPDSVWVIGGDTNEVLCTDEAVGIPEITMDEFQVSIATVLDRIISEHEGIIKCAYTNDRAIMWPGLHGINLDFPMPLNARLINDMTLFRMFYENWKTLEFDSSFSNDVTDVFLVVMDKFRQKKSWVVSRSQNGVQDYGFCWLVSTNAVNYLCNAPSSFPAEELDHFSKGEAKFFAVFASEAYILGFRALSQKDVEKMPDLSRLSYMNIQAFSGKRFRDQRNSNDHGNSNQHSTHQSDVANP